MMRRSREAHIIGESVLKRDGAIDEVYGSLGNISSGTFLHLDLCHVINLKEVRQI